MTGKITCCMLVGKITRSAVWWRMQGFPVPLEVPNNALGEMRKDAIVYFDWKPSDTVTPSTSLPSV